MISKSRRLTDMQVSLDLISRELSKISADESRPVLERKELSSFSEEIQRISRELPGLKSKNEVIQLVQQTIIKALALLRHES